jgi:hypothetical protein
MNKEAPFGTAEASPELPLFPSQHEVPPCANSFGNEDSAFSPVIVIQLSELASLTRDALHLDFGGVSSFYAI